MSRCTRDYTAISTTRSWRVQHVTTHAQGGGERQQRARKRYDRRGALEKEDSTTPTAGVMGPPEEK